MSVIIQLCVTQTKSPRQTPTKLNRAQQCKRRQSFAESVERHFSIESDHFDSNHFHEVNNFIQDNHRYFYPPEDPDGYRFDVGNDHELVEDVDAQTHTKLVKFLKRGKAPGADTIHNEVLLISQTRGDL